MPTLTADDGTSLDYEVVGQGFHNILVLQDAQSERAALDPLLSEFDLSGVRLLIPQIRSTMPIATRISDLLNITGQETSSSITVIGIGNSGSTAQHLAQQHPERVRGMVLISSDAPELEPGDRISVLATLLVESTGNVNVGSKAQAIRKVIKNSRVVQLPTVSGNLLQEKPRELAAVMSAFLAGMNCLIGFE